jgi:hypothetical protein
LKVQEDIALTDCLVSTQKQGMSKLVVHSVTNVPSRIVVKKIETL